MKSRQLSKQDSSLSGYVDNLVAAASPNPLKRSSSQKPLNDSIMASELAPAQVKPRAVQLSPLKKRARSEEGAAQLFATARHYGDEQGEASIMLSRISELTETSPLPIPHKEVTFRENLIMRNAHGRREESGRPARTPSILKKSQLLRNNCEQFIQQNSQASSAKAALKEDRDERAAKTNEVVRRRYFTILDRFRAKYATRLSKGGRLRSDEKYQDELFPPIASSALRGGKQAPDDSIRWARVSELYRDRPLVVFNQEAESSVFVKCADGRENFMGQAFNCIKSCKGLLGRMFESAQVNEYGVYLVKIFQENVWKLVIVDDYVPVRHPQLAPAFLALTHTNEQLPLEIWPFLLEKAYANYYANYESLHSGNALDFLEEITGLAAQPFHYHSNQKKLRETMTRLHKLAAQEDVAFLGWVEAQSAYVALERGEEGTLTAYLSDEEATTSLAVEQVFEYFDKVWAVVVGEHGHSAVSTVGMGGRKSQQQYGYDISLRTLKVQRSGVVSLSLRQRDRRLYQRSSLPYNYIWVRVLLLQREFEDCRWVDARYGAEKSLRMRCWLEAGEYYVVVLPEWRASHCYELSLLLWADAAVSVGRREYDENEQLVEKGCRDLAQRRGRLQQINLYACSYTLVCEEVGMLLENIVNERYQGSIRINRSIAGLKPAVHLLPFNPHFYLHRPPNQLYSPHLSVYIPADQSYTVVLLMRGGIDRSFLRKFDFGR